MCVCVCGETHRETERQSKMETHKDYLSVFYPLNELYSMSYKNNNTD